MTSTTKAVAALAFALALNACGQAKQKAEPAPQASAPSISESVLRKPEGWDGDNFFLGRWKANSTAGRAVLDVLTVEPNRVRWGNAANGKCDADYSVETMPWGRDGRFPDQLVPPSAPSDLVYAVTRLTLMPKPCATGDAVIQLALPLGEGSLQVVTYDAEGNMTGNYPDLTPLQ